MNILTFLFLILPVLFSVAFLTLLERKLLGVIGIRLGPYKVSVGGMLQPLGDALKLANKSCNYLFNFSFFFYYMSGAFLILYALFFWLLSFTEPVPISFKFSLLGLLLLLSMNSFMMVFSGWSTLSKYTLIGSMRTVAQLISYEGALYMCLFYLLLCFNCFNMNLTKFYPFPLFFVYFPFIFYIWMPCVLAELNRTPFDFSEGESELVSGFNTDFGSSVFTLIFLGEYSSVLFFSFLTSFFFFFSYLAFPLTFLSILWVRGVLPRFRFDKLMMVCWKFFIPLLTVLFVSTYFYIF